MPVIANIPMPTCYACGKSQQFVQKWHIKSFLKNGKETFYKVCEECVTERPKPKEKEPAKEHLKVDAIKEEFRAAKSEAEVNEYLKVDAILHHDDLVKQNQELRDRFAIAALQSLLLGESGQRMSKDEIAEQAYIMADSMLNERNQND
jgi:hypothetical protein